MGCDFASLTSRDPIRQCINLMTFDLMNSWEFMIVIAMKIGENEVLVMIDPFSGFHYNQQTEAE